MIKLFYFTRVSICLVCLVLSVSCKTPDRDFRSLDPDLPGAVPEIFAEGIILMDGSNEFSICFAPDLSEILFSRREPGKPNQIMQMKRIEDGWSDPIHYSTGMMYLSMTNTGRIYFTGFPATWDSQHVAYQDSLHAAFIKLSDSINYLPFAGHPLIGPDEDFLIYDSQTDTDNKDI